MQLAADAGIAAPSIAAALEARFLSAKLELRGECAEVFGGVQPDASGVVGNGMRSREKTAFAKSVAKGLFCAKILAYAQGFSLLGAASEEKGWGLKMAELAQIWRGGCIIRAALLDNIIGAFSRNPDLPSLMVDPEIAAAVKENVGDLRTVVSKAIAAGVPVPAMTSALQYFDGMRRARGPANIIQAQRDCFGAHTFKRLDMDGSFHAEW